MRNLFVKIIIALTTLHLAACVTVMEDGGTLEVDEKKAIQSYVDLGLNYIRVGNRDSARRSLQKALELDKRSSPANEGMALLYQLEGEKEVAEDYFKKAIRYDSDNSRARNNYGSFLYEHDRYDEAYEQFEEASKDLSYTQRPYALTNLGRTAAAMGNEERAEAAFRHALSLNSKLPIALVELADITYKNRNYSEAKKLIDQYGKVTRHSPRTLWLGIRIERTFGNRDKEASYALQLKSLHPYSKEYLEYKRTTEGAIQ
ncbi:type IV pilus biogenesis/stability protein PilW [Aurantivibrio plasticivorans]